MKVTVTVDEQGRLTLPPEVARQLQAGQHLVIDLLLEGGPFAQFVETLPPLEEGSATYYRRERGHEA